MKEGAEVQISTATMAGGTGARLERRGGSMHRMPALGRVRSDTLPEGPVLLMTSMTLTRRPRAGVRQCVKAVGDAL